MEAASDTWAAYQNAKFFNELRILTDIIQNQQTKGNSVCPSKNKCSKQHIIILLITPFQHMLFDISAYTACYFSKTWVQCSISLIICFKIANIAPRCVTYILFLSNIYLRNSMLNTANIYVYKSTKQILSSLQSYRSYCQKTVQLQQCPRMEACCVYLWRIRSTVNLCAMRYTVH